ncbi:MAG: bifunctional demethylmenaquinone methyltransferase/2-methoxy-6-polyprenyl-1,4-benzoquinol methylase UbiE [Bacteroidales bacterium]
MVKPYHHLPSGKKEQVEQMFDKIAWRYDFLNHFLSWGIDKRWRKKVVRALDVYSEADTLLDVATGTGDLAIELLKHTPASIVGVDLSQQMLDKGIEKIKLLKLQDRAHLEKMDVEALQFPDNTFTAVSVAFGVRNFDNLQAGLQEMYRVLKPGGKIVILEFSMPKNSIVHAAYRFYAKWVLPFWGRLLSREAFAYSYLPDSIEAFPAYEELLAQLRVAGFSNGAFKSLTAGVACLYTAEK